MIHKTCSVGLQIKRKDETTINVFENRLKGLCFVFFPPKPRALCHIGHVAQYSTYCVEATDKDRLLDR